MGAKRTLTAPAAAYLAVGAVALVLPATALAVSETNPTDHSIQNTVETAAVTRPGSHSQPRLRLSHRAHAELKLTRTFHAAPVGARGEIRGALRPAVGLGGRYIELQVDERGRWIDAGRTRTSRTGHFALNYRVPAGSERMRAMFAGDRFQQRAFTPVATVTGLEYAEVSWYYDAGDTACGFHATYGIASRTLPCGSHVTLSYGGRTVVATVDDRGPFVYSRLFDLNQTVAQTLGMSGVATVLASS